MNDKDQFDERAAAGEDLLEGLEKLAQAIDRQPVPAAWRARNAPQRPRRRIVPLLLGAAAAAAAAVLLTVVLRPGPQKPPNTVTGPNDVKPAPVVAEEPAATFDVAVAAAFPAQVGSVGASPAASALALPSGLSLPSLGEMKLGGFSLSIPDLSSESTTVNPS